jgi:hypothetical protein
MTTPYSHTSGGQPIDYGHSPSNPTSILPVSPRPDESLYFSGSARQEESREPAPWYLAPSYQPSELLFNSAGVVEAGTLEALVEWLTTPRYRELTLSRIRNFPLLKSCVP